MYKDSPWVSLLWRRFDWDAVHIDQAFSNMHYHMRLKQQSVTKARGSHVQYEKKIPLAYYSCLNGKLDFSSSAFRPESSREWIPTINVAFHWLVFETHFRRPSFFFIWLIFSTHSMVLPKLWSVVSWKCFKLVIMILFGAQFL